MRRHLLILLVVTVLIRGLMFISYPLGGMDDNQAAQRFLIGELLDGNFLIGNLRFNTGYAFAIAPVEAVAQVAGRFDDRIVLLVQTTLAALIPFMIYDILRRRRSALEAFGVALLVAFDPFGWQWAHLLLPVWLVAFCAVMALWLVQIGLDNGRRRWLWAAAAGLVLGIAVLGRINFAPVVAVLGLSFLALRNLSLQTRLSMFVALGGVSGGILVAYMLLIHLPSTGTLSPSCVSGGNLMASMFEKDIPVTAENGPATAELLELLTLTPLYEVNLYSDTYPLWRTPGPWVPQADSDAFLAQRPTEQIPTLNTVFPEVLIHFIGPCPTDALMRAAHHEAITRYPLQWVAGIVVSTAEMTVQRGFFDDFYLPRYAEIDFVGEGTLGFRQAQGDFYNGQVVWEPGIRLYSALFDVAHLIKWLAPRAIVYALWQRDWFYRTVTVLLLVLLILIAATARPEPRYYAVFYPAYMILIGGLLMAVARRLRSVEPR